MLGIAQRRHHALEQPLRRQPPRRHVAAPAPDGPDQAAVADTVQQKHGGRAGGAQQQAADRRPDCARHVVVDAVEQHRAADVLARHLLAHCRLPGGRDDGAADGDAEDRDDQGDRMQQADIRQYRDEDAAGQFQQHADQHDLAAVVVVRQHAGQDRQRHQRKGRGHLDHGDHQRAALFGGDDPGGGHRLRPGAEVGEQVGDPDDAERREREGGERADPQDGLRGRGGRARRCGGKIVVGRNGLEHGGLCDHPDTAGGGRPMVRLLGVRVKTRQPRDEAAAARGLRAAAGTRAWAGPGAGRPGSGTRRSAAPVRPGSARRRCRPSS